VVEVRFACISSVPGVKCTLDGVVKYSDEIGICSFFGVSQGAHSYSIVAPEGWSYVSGDDVFGRPLYESGTTVIEWLPYPEIPWPEDQPWMMKFVFEEIAEAKGTIVVYRRPNSATPGDTVTISVDKVQNIGAGPGNFQLRLIDRDENVDVDKTGWFTLAAGASTSKTLSGTMPERDWRLALLLERVLPTGAVTVDDQKKFTAINIENWWDAIRAYWNGLTRWQKTLFIGTPIIGAVVIVTKPYKKH